MCKLTKGIVGISCFLALLTVVSCSKTPLDTEPQEETAMSASDQDLKLAKAETISCSEALTQFNAILETRNTCGKSDECTTFATSPAGCWRTFNVEAREDLGRLMNVLYRDQCRVFLPMYKCSSMPGKITCASGRCGWKK